ncbi:MAG: hypothetical protein Q9168_004151 [Polycauliona sp. 1 TL-2023]
MLSTVLWAFGKLLPHHPTACRPFVGQIRALVFPLIAPNTSTLPGDGLENGHLCSQITAWRARHVFVLLGGCAVKNNQAQEWARSLTSVIHLSHQTADLVFRALIEDWEPLVQTRLHNGTGPVPSTGTPGLPDDESGLPGWNGISAGLDRLYGLLLTIQAHLQSATAAAVTIPIDKIVNLVDRMLSALPPSQEALKDTGKGTRTNPEIDRDERETLWTGLPQIHVSAMQILELLILRLGESPMPLGYRFLDYVLWVFEHEHSQYQIREIVYRVVTLLLPRCRTGVPQTVASSLERCVRMGCKDLLPDQSSSSNSNKDIGKDTSSADAYTKTSDLPSAPSTERTELQKVAEQMLSMALTNLPSSFLRLSLRSRIDQTAILAQSNLMLRSSILNAPAYRGGQQQSSLMPLLARNFPQDQGSEALIRPRLPPVQSSIDDQSVDFAQDVEDQEESYLERRRSSPPILAPRQDNLITKFLGSEKQEQAALSSQASHNRTHSSEAHAAANFTGEPQSQTNPTVPAKRSLDQDPDSRDIAKSESTSGSTPIAEPASKRFREDNGEKYVPPDTEDDLPPPLANDTQRDHEARPADPSASLKALTTLRTTTEDVDDDSSDDSTIPPMDLILATDDEDEDEDGDENEGE